MDWKECLNNRIAKETKIDRNLIVSARKIAKIKIESADALPEHHSIGKISLLYDALREYLECISIEKGFKIYNHECYAALLSEIMKLPREAKLFDSLRKIRNNINYYGRDVSKEEAVQIISDLKELIGKFKGG